LVEEVLMLLALRQILSEAIRYFLKVSRVTLLFTVTFVIYIIAYLKGRKYGDKISKRMKR